MTSLRWETDEYKHTKKGADWFWAVGIIGASLAIIAIIFDNFLFGILLIIGIGTLMIYAAREPLRIDVVIDEKGIRIGKEFYPYSSLQSFWIEEDREHPRILLHTHSILIPLLAVGLEETNSEEVKKLLKTYIEEKEIRESVFETIMERIGF